LLLQRLLETCPYPFPNPDSNQYVGYYDVVVGAVRGDWDRIRAALPALEGVPEDPFHTGVVRSLAAIADRDPTQFARRLQECIAGYRRYGAGRVHKYICLESHGLYELARRTSPDLVAGFDANHPLPWDAEYHAWLQSNDRPLPDIDWEKFPEEIRAGLRDLPRPAWWGVLRGE
jgi:hypothetical protein